MSWFCSSEISTVSSTSCKNPFFISTQVSERLTYLTECIDNYGGYRAHQKSVQKWQVSVQTRARSQTSLGARADVHEKRTLVEKAVTLIEELAANKPEMDKLNQLGAKVIAAGKVKDLNYDLNPFRPTVHMWYIFT